MVSDKRNTHKLSSKIARINKLLLFVVYSLVSISTLFVYSATRNISYVKNNILWIAIGTIMMIIIMMFDYRVTKKYINYIYIISILTLAYTKFFGVTKLGAKRWIDFGFIQIQPSEFVKIFLIMIYSFWIVKRFNNGINSFKDITYTYLTFITARSWYYSYTMFFFFMYFNIV